MQSSLGQKRVLSLKKFQTLDQADSFGQLPQKEFQFKDNRFDDAKRQIQREEMQKAAISTVYAKELVMDRVATE